MLKNVLHPFRIGFAAFALLPLLTGWSSIGIAATWTALTNRAPGPAGTMIQLTDGTIMVHVNNQNWMRLTPDAFGSYVNGTWTTTIPPMSISRLYFASNVLPSGNVLVLGGEYSGTANVLNWSGAGEVYNPVANTWTPISPYPATACFIVTAYGGSITADSAIVAGMNPPSTAGFQPGWSISGTGIPPDTTIVSVDSANQITLSQNATATRNSQLSLSTANTGSTSVGSRLISDLSKPTTGYQVGWTVSGTGIPAGATITSIDSASQIRISANASGTASGVALTFGIQYRPAVCFGDHPTMLLSDGRVLASFDRTTNIYDPGTNTWSPGGTKIYDRSDEEGWALLSDGTILTYDIGKSASAGSGYAEKYNPISNTWLSISPSDGTANGTLPVLGSDEQGPILRLEDGRVFAIGGNGHTALYTPSSNTWAAGPDMNGTLGGNPFLFAADDAPAAVLPNGHVILAGDAGNGMSSTGDVASGSSIVANIPTSITDKLLTGWAVSGAGIPANTTILSVGVGQVTMSRNATATGVAELIKFGGDYSKPTQLFDFDPVAGAISPVSPALNDPNLALIPAFVTRMLVLPTGQLLFGDSSNRLWVYTPDGTADPSLLPTIAQVVDNGGGVYTLTGTQLNGHSAGAGYGDDAEMDENYPIIRLVNAAGNVFYARTFNWSSTAVGISSTPETVNFTLPAGLPIGAYSLFVSGAGISSNPFSFTLGQTGCSSKISPGGQVYPASGGGGTITITTDVGCAWTANPPPAWVTFSGSASGTGGGALGYSVAANGGSARAATITVAGIAFTIEQQAASIPGLGFIGSMPHLAAQENWTTAFTLVNKGATPAQARVSLFGDPAGTLTLPLAFPQQLAAPGPVLAASFDRTLAGNASLVVNTAGPQTPPVQIGSTQLAGTGPVDGFAIFRQILTAQEAVVPMETRNASSYLLAFDNTNGIVLGVALENVSAQAVNVGVVIRDDNGAQIGTAGATLSLAGSGHTSFVLSTQFPATENQRGTIEFTTASSGQISVLGIRFTPPNNALTTIPALANVGANGGSIAHIATGNGWQTTFVLVNTGTNAAQIHLKFLADISGAPLALPLTFPQSGASTISSSVDQTLAAGASLLIQSAKPTSDPLPTIGSAQLTTTGNVGGFVIFRYNPNGQEAIVPLESRNANAYILAFDNTNGTATGVAINSVSSQAVNVPVVVRDDMGNQIGTDTLNMAANGHLAFTLVSDKYPVTANLRGTIEFTTPANAQIGTLGIRIPITHTFTTLPALVK